MITAANSAEAYRLKSKLNAANIILGDYLDLPATMLSNSRLIKLPNPASASYAHEMLTLCLDKDIEKIYPVRDSELMLLTGAEILFNEFGITIVKRTDAPMNK